MLLHKGQITETISPTAATKRNIGDLKFLATWFSIYLLSTMTGRTQSGTSEMDPFVVWFTFAHRSCLPANVVASL